ncbi:MAG: AAA family ATPase [Chlorobiales bacterium]|nr:AAA family ATPase [Chlorobiales bacterium]
MEDKTLQTTVQEPEKLREQLRELMEAEGISQNTAALQIGISAGLLSAWLSGTYKGSAAAVGGKVEGFLARRKEVQAMPTPEAERFPVTVETEVYLAVTRAIRNCHLKGKIGVVTAHSGSGKTRAAREYVGRNAGSMLIECHHSFPARMVLGAIAQSCGVEARGSIHELLVSICDRLRGSGRVLVLDEAEHLKPQVLDVVRRINDWSGIGIVYVGLPRFMGQLQSLRRDFEYIWNRVRVRAGIERGRVKELGDARMLLESVLPLVGDGVPESFHQYCGGDIRKLEELFFACLAVSRRSSQDVSVKLVKAVAQQLSMEAI